MLMVDIEKKFPGFHLKVQFEGSHLPTGLLGASGSGKSMTLRCIAGLERPDAGRIILNGRVLYDAKSHVNLPSQERRVGMLFQNYALFPHMTVAQNIGFALNQLTRNKREDRIRKQLEAVHMLEFAGRYPYQLSGGQQQRVALARALAVQPEVLLLDEPFSALDDHLRTIMIRQLGDLLSGFAGDLILVSHNMDEAYQICDQLVVLSEGRVEAQGHKQTIFEHPPSCDTARLTGCKNLVSAYKIPEEKCVTKPDAIANDSIISIPEWGMHVYVPDAGEQQKNIRFAGIRAHHIRLAKENEQVNVVHVEVSAASETPFRAFLYLRIQSAPQNESGWHLLWDISREEWAMLQTIQSPYRIHLPPESIMLMSR